MRGWSSSSAYTAPSSRRSCARRRRTSVMSTPRGTPCRKAWRPRFASGTAIAAKGTLEAWLWGVMLNAIRSHYRERAHMLVLADDLRDQEAAPGSVNGRISAETVRFAVRRLPERQRLVLFLRFYADLDYATIAALLEMSEGTVGASLNAARTTLRGLLEEVGA
jgi:DNA-directed RNA polymerase specialized sigma24 family protein